MNAQLPAIRRERVTLAGWYPNGLPIERCNGEFIETYLLLPGTGVYFLVHRERAAAVNSEQRVPT